MALELPDIWTLAGLVLALIGIAAAMISVPGPTHGEFWISRICFVGATFLFLAKLAMWGAEDLTPIRLGAVAVAGAAIAICLAYALQWTSKKEGKTSRADIQPSLLFECQTGSLPSSSSRLYMLQLWPIPVENGGGGLSEQFSTDGKSEIVWPKSATGFPIMAYKCQLTNYDQATLFGIELDLNLMFQEEIKDETQAGTAHSGNIFLSRKWPISVTKIDPGVGNPFVFYIVNFTTNFVTVTLPELGKAKRLDDQASKSIRIISPYQNFQMHFMPFHAAEPESSQPNHAIASPPLPKPKPPFNSK